VAPATVVQVVPALVETCHWTVGVGEPEAAALNEAVELAATLSLAGWAVIVGSTAGMVTVKAAGAVVAVPAEFLNTASYW
jgi:hypothetical protein